MIFSRLIHGSHLQDIEDLEGDQSLHQSSPRILQTEIQKMSTSSGGNQQEDIKNYKEEAEDDFKTRSDYQSMYFQFHSLYNHITNEKL